MPIFICSNGKLFTPYWIVRNSIESIIIRRERSRLSNRIKGRIGKFTNLHIVPDLHIDESGLPQPPVQGLVHDSDSLLERQ